jgi:hypothetical protein
MFMPLLRERSLMIFHHPNDARNFVGTKAPAFGDLQTAKPNLYGCLSLVDVNVRRLVWFMAEKIKSVTIFAMDSGH